MDEKTKAPRLAHRAVKPEKILALGFLLLILVGGFLLALPIASVDRRSIGALGGLFTATSAVCVTGLTVIDVGRTLSLFGQIVLICLIQIGGLGFVVFATLAMVALGRRISLRNRMLIRDSMSQNGLSGIIRLTLWYSLLALVIELAGACVLMTRFIPRFGVGKGIWYGFFHSISAFCNAGFDLFGGGRSLLDFQTDPTVILTLGGLIVLGGLGFSVIMECLQNRFRFGKLSLHAKLVLVTTGVLLLTGALLTMLLEWNNPDTLGGGNLNGFQKSYNALFQSVTLRTAGFVSIDQAKLCDTSKLLGLVWMFIGASPASTGGGVKTTTVCLLIIMLVSVIRGQEHINVFKREISFLTVRRAVSIILIGFSVIMACAGVISFIEPAGKFSLIDLLYEATSALSTTGLSAAGTGALSKASQWLLMPLMYFGRVGPLTLAYALASRFESTAASNRVHYPEEKIMIG